MRVARNRISPARQEQLVAIRAAKKKSNSQPQTSQELAALLPQGDLMRRRGLSPILSPLSSPARSPQISRSPRSEDVSRESRDPLPFLSVPEHKVQPTPTVVVEEPRAQIRLVAQVEEAKTEAVLEIKAEVVIEPKQPIFRPNVLAVVMNKDGKVLCGERSDFSDQSFWQCPQGGVDGNEDIVEAAKREVQEELGLSPERLKPLPKDFQPAQTFRYTFKAPVKKDGKMFDGQEQQVVLFVLDGDLSDCKLEVPGQTPEFKRVEWRSFSEIVPFVLPSKHEVYQSIQGIVHQTLAACSPGFLSQLLVT